MLDLFLSGVQEASRRRRRGFESDLGLHRLHGRRFVLGRLTGLAAGSAHATAGATVTADEAARERTPATL